ncbi:MAG: D-alanyl-D-alanine carboxypeptidase [Cyclobacteriaceae bacterium]
MKSVSLLVIIGFFIGCATLKISRTERALNRQIDDNPLLNKHFTGLTLFDPLTQEWLYERNADRYFTPASNTKLLTLFAGIKILGDSIPAFKYGYRQDSLFFWGTGDPTFLHPDFMEQPAYDFLKQHEGPLLYVPNDMRSQAFGPGWSWDDYAYSFQPERSAFPIYGNVVRINNGRIIPSIFEEFMFPDELGSRRHPEMNLFTSPLIGSVDETIPFKVYPELSVQLLSDTLKRKVLIANRPDDFEVLYSRPTKSLYEIMMKRSDNFYAEQILLLCSSLHSDNLFAENTMAYISNNYFNDSNPPKWVDGSGLSRYNLVTPRFIVQLLHQLLNEKGQDWLFDVLPVGGVSGTIKNWYPGINQPFVYAKTGTLRNNHNLSGYLITDTGRLLLFSFMNNNFTLSNSEIKTGMQQVLNFIRVNF